MAASDAMFASDKAQSVTPEIRQAYERHNADHPDNPVEVPPLAVQCARDKKHGALLMSAKSGMLECGVCGWSVAAPI